MATDAKFSLRTNAELLAKIHYIAEYNGRSSTKEIEVLMKRHIKAFEAEHGEIKLDNE